MKKNKGFTLLEILSVMVLLSLIAILAFPTVDKYISETKEKMYEQQVNNIILMAKSWASENKVLLPKEEGEEITITLGMLMDEGYVEQTIKNPITKKPFLRSSEILIRKVSEIYEYEFFPQE
ncbi:MAG: type II secretion system protein [Mollicutes bacterium]|nr:type II secretion system protein [Mollicutes bacterium]